MNRDNFELQPLGTITISVVPRLGIFDPAPCKRATVYQLTDFVHARVLIVTNTIFIVVTKTMPSTHI